MRQLPLIICCILLAVFTGCERLESGDPPNFSGQVTATAVSQSQLALSWSAGSDDINASDELAYGIWYEKDSADLDLDAAPAILTKEGARAYNLTGLDSNKSYSIVVRVMDRGQTFSENTTAQTGTTSAAGAGPFEKEDSMNLPENADSLFSGSIFNDGKRDFAIHSGDAIRWYKNDGSGGFDLDSRIFQLNATIRHAWLAQVRDDSDLDDLFVETANNLRMYTNNGDADFDQASFSVSDFQSDSLVFGDFNNDDDLDLAYLDTLNFVVIFTGDGKGAFTQSARNQTANASLTFRLEDLNDDDLADLVTFGNEGLKVSLAEDEAFDFGAFSTVDADGFDKDTQWLFLADGNGDNYPDIYMFERDNSANTTKLSFYANEKDGTFDTTPEVTTYEDLLFSDPAVVDFDNTGTLELMLLQKVSNNVAIYSAGTGTYSTRQGYYGGIGTISHAVMGDFSSQAQQDFVLVSNEADKITVLLRASVQ